MTESIVGGTIVAIIAGLLGALLGSKDKVTVEDLERHRKDPNPHTNCPVHTTEIGFIKHSLSSIETKVDRLLDER